MAVFCRDCDEMLTLEEALHYGDQCERCVRIDHERVVRWRNGGSDPELDEMYGSPSPTRH